MDLRVRKGVVRNKEEGNFRMCEKMQGLPPLPVLSSRGPGISRVETNSLLCPFSRL